MISCLKVVYLPRYLLFLLFFRQILGLTIINSSFQTIEFKESALNDLVSSSDVQGKKKNYLSTILVTKFFFFLHFSDYFFASTF